MRLATVPVWTWSSTEIFVCSDSVGFVGKGKGNDMYLFCYWNHYQGERLPYIRGMAEPECVITPSNVCKPPFISSRSYTNECTGGTSISETIVKVESFIIKVIKSIPHIPLLSCSGIRICLLVQDRASPNTKAITSSCRKQNDTNPSQNDAGNDHPNTVPNVNRQRERPQSWHTVPRY